MEVVEEIVVSLSCLMANPQPCLANFSAIAPTARALSALAWSAVGGGVGWGGIWSNDGADMVE